MRAVPSTATSAAIAAASGARFGRVRTAAPVSNPARSGACFVRAFATTTAASHKAVTGTSLIGEKSISRNVALTESRSAAIPPASGSPSSRPRAIVQNTASAPNIGITRYIARSPSG